MNWSKGNINVFDEKILLVSIIGIIHLLRENLMSIDEAEKFLFSPHTRKILKQKKCNNNIVELIDYGCELEDIKSILPNEFLKSLKELEQKTLLLLSKYEELETDFWIDE